MQTDLEFIEALKAVDTAYYQSVSAQCTAQGDEFLNKITKSNEKCFAACRAILNIKIESREREIATLEANFRLLIKTRLEEILNDAAMMPPSEESASLEEIATETAEIDDLLAAERKLNRSIMEQANEQFHTTMTANLSEYGEIIRRDDHAFLASLRRSDYSFSDMIEAKSPMSFALRRAIIDDRDASRARRIARRQSAKDELFAQLLEKNDRDNEVILKGFEQYCADIPAVTSKE